MPRIFDKIAISNLTEIHGSEKIYNVTEARQTKVANYVKRIYSVLHMFSAADLKNKEFSLEWNQLISHLPSC